MKIVVISKNNYLSDLIKRYINFASVELISPKEYLAGIIKADLIIGDEINQNIDENQASIILNKEGIKNNHSKIDNLSKPINIIRLFELINGYYKKFTSTNENIIMLYDYKLNLNKKKIYKAGEEIALTQKEIDLISFFYQNFDKKFRKTEILESVWGYSDKITSHTFETHLYRLRQKLSNIPSLIINDEYGQYFINPLLLK